MGANLLVIWGEDSLGAVYPVKRHVGMPGRAARSGWMACTRNGSKAMSSRFTLNALC